MHKKLTLIILSLIAGYVVKAQTQQGGQLLGGGISFGFTNGKTDFMNYNNSSYNYNGKSKDITFFVSPVYSYFIADNLDLGASIGYGTGKTTYNYAVANTNYNALPSNISNQNYLGGIYLRKYFLYKEKIGIRAGPFAEYQKYKYQYEYLEPQVNNNNTSQTGTTLNTGLILDFVYFPTKRIGITSSLGSAGYIYSDSKNQTTYYNDNDKFNSFGFRFVSTLNLAVVYRFRK